MSYQVWRFMAFKPNDQSYGHIHGIVCSNDLILCTRVHIGMANNVVGEADPRTPMGPADRAPFGSTGGGGRTKSGSRRSTRAVYPASELSGEIILLLLHVWVYWVLARERWVLQYTPAANETERPCFSAFEPPPTLRMGLLLYAQGVTDRWQHRQG